MVASRVFESMEIESHRGPYRVVFDEAVWERLAADTGGNVHFMIDRRIAELYEAPLQPVLHAPSVVHIEATENSKSLERLPGYVEHLVGCKLRRDHCLIAIGGGIIQDIACFLAATMLRGVEWRFYPTTLLAQADSCIGSKSSINCGGAKNILGTFTPAREIVISTNFLDTLDERDVRSGVGEMLKVHAIDGPDSFGEIARDYGDLFRDPAVMRNYIRQSLEIKKRFIEADEFDNGIRNVMNYGHSFGHAIEAATDYAVPHGLAVTIGMDMANYVSARLGLADESHFRRMHPILARNYAGFEVQHVAIEPFLAAISKDKKNIGTGTVTLILPDQEGKVAKRVCANDDRFRGICSDYLERERAA